MPETETLPAVTSTPPKGASESIRNLLAPPVEASVEVAKPEVTPAAEKKEVAAPAAKAVETKAVEALKVVESAPDPEVTEFLKSTTPKTQNRFNELVNKRVEPLATEKAKALAEEMFKARAAELQPDPKITQELEQAKKERDDLIVEFRKLGVEKSPEFRARFVERPKAIKAELATILADADIENPDAFIASLDKVTDKGVKKKINETLSELGPLYQAEANNLLGELLKIEKDRESVTVNPELALKVIEQEKQGQVKAFVERLGKERAEALGRTIPVLKTEIPLLFEGDDGKAFEQDFVAKTQDLDKTDLEALPANVRSQLIGSALMAKPLIAKVNALTKERDELRAEVDAYQKRGLGAGNGRVASQSTETTDESPLATAENLLGFRPGSMPRKRAQVR